MALSQNHRVPLTAFSIQDSLCPRHGLPAVTTTQQTHCYCEAHFAGEETEACCCRYCSGAQWHPTLCDPHGPLHSRLPCPSLSPWVCSNSLSQWYHPSSHPLLPPSALALKIGDTKGTFRAKMGTMKKRNSKDLTEAEEMKKKWQEYTEECTKTG